MLHPKNFSSKGFTLIELLIVLALLVTIIGFVTISLANTSNKTSLGTTVNIVISEMRQQQIKAMIGDTDGSGSDDAYGIYYGTTSYTIFKGSTYAVGNVTNLNIPYGDTIELASTTFPSSTVIFLRLSGEIAGFSPGSNMITLQSTGNQEQKTIELNRYGVISAIN